MKKVLFLIILFSFFLACKNEKSSLSLKEKDELNLLLIKANDFKYSKKERLFYNNKAFSILKQRKDSTSLNYLFKIADRFYNAEENESYFRVSRNILKISIERKDSLNIGKAINYIGDYYFYGYKYDSAYYYYSKVEKFQNLLKRPFIDERLVFNKANILLFEKNFSQAEVEFTKILRNVKANKNDRMIYECYLALGMALRGMNNNQGAIEYYIKALKQTEKLKTDKQYKLLKAQPFNYIAIALQKEGEFLKASINSQKALSIDKFEKYDKNFYCYLLNTYSYSKFKLGDESCLKDFNQTLRIGDSLPNMHIQLNSRINLSEYYLKKKDTNKAAEFSNDVLTLAHQNKVFEDELKALELLAKIDSKNSSQYRERYIVLNDSLQNVERATRNKFARIEFETDEITNQKNIVEAEKDKISAQRWIIVGFSLFFILLLVLLYMSRLQRAKNRELQYLQQQQQANVEIYQLMLDQQQKIEEGKQIEKRRISKELHDGVMGKLTAIRLNLFVLTKKNDPETIARCLEHVDEIQNIEKEIRKISHDLNQNLFTDVSDFTLMVNNLVDNIKEHSNIHFNIIADEKIDWNTINSGIKMQVYRILQEALHNIEKYAQAKNVVVSMLEKEHKLSVTITDDGVGFDTSSSKSGIGHKNMRERAAEIEADFTITSLVGKGTTINLIIPT